MTRIISEDFDIRRLPSYGHFQPKDWDKCYPMATLPGGVRLEQRQDGGFVVHEERFMRSGYWHYPRAKCTIDRCCKGPW